MSGRLAELVAVVTGAGQAEGTTIGNGRATAITFAITNVSSITAVAAGTSPRTNTPAGYKTSKAALNALTQTLALESARYGIRVNAIMPGLIDTPMGVDQAARMIGIDRAEYAALRDSRVPLKGGMGTAWDVANAAAFLASDQARFITGALLPVDGGQSARIG